MSALVSVNCFILCGSGSCLSGITNSVIVSWNVELHISINDNELTFFLPVHVDVDECSVHSSE